MPLTITFENGSIKYDSSSYTTKRPNKGKSLVAFPSDFTVIDLETTGLYPQFDEIIEIAAIRVRNDVVTETFSTLVKPYDEIDEFITELTGITNEMLSDAPAPEEIFPVVRQFIGDDIVVGHNVNFDVNFLYDWFEDILNVPFSNDFIDTMRLARKALPELKHHRLVDIATALNVSPSGSHRGLCDCQTTLDCFLKLFDQVSSSVGVEEFINSFKKKRKNYSISPDLRNVTTENTSFDETHPLFGKRCVFTGALEKMIRVEAAQLVVDFGGICENNVTKKTNYLILGNNDYCTTIKDGKSLKQKKAESYKLSGQDIEIIPENVFYDMVLAYQKEEC